MSDIQNEKSNEAIIEQVKTNIKENPNSFFLMKKGDYSVHVLIEEIKNLCTIEENQLPKPIIKITCFNQTKRTSKNINKCQAHVFNEHIYFDATDLSAETLDSSKILIEAYDYHNSDRKNYFGMQEFDFEYIYSKENHCIKNLWIALANPEASDITKINGYLKLSISITSTEDEKIELNPDPNNDEDCMLPPQIKTTYKQLKIFIFKGEDFPDMEVSLLSKEKTTNKRCDGYLEVKYLGTKKCTQVVSMNNNIILWNEIIELPVPQPIISQKVIFAVKDKKNNIVGSFILTIDDIIGGKYEELTCIDIYGTLKAVDNSKAGKMMNESPEVGSRWKGRVYLKIKCNDCQYPAAGVQKIKDKILIKSVEKINRNNLWSLYVKLYSASFLPKENGTYDIKISVQDKSDSFMPKKAMYRNIDWNLVKTFTINTLTENLKELPDLIIYLTEKGKEICYQRIKLSEFHLKDDTFVIKLFPEPCVNAVKEVFLSGIVKMKIKLFNRALDDEKKIDVSAFKDGDEYGQSQINMGINSILTGGSQTNNFDDEEDLEKKYLNNEHDNNEQQELDNNKGEFKYYTIVACVYMTRYIIAGSSTGLSDPYCRIMINGETRQTSIRHKCVNGIWNEKLVFDTASFNYNDQSTWPVMLVTVMDKDYSSTNMLGYSYIWLSDTNYAYNSTKIIKPKWNQLYLKKSNRAQGQILLSFYIFDNEHREDLKKIKIEPETIPFNVEINVLGLRNLKPLNFIKIKKPYISFDLNSINVSSTNGKNLQPVTTLPNEVGSDPNINSVIKFSVNLPKDEIYIPQFQCDVYDHVLGGLSKRVLGVFLIDIKKIISETKRIYNVEFEEAELVYKEIQDKRDREISGMKKQNGMSEKEDLQNSDDNIISTSSKKDDNLIISNDLNEPLIDNKGQNGGNTNNNNLSKISDTYICRFPSDLNKIYRGIIDNNLLMKEKDNSEYFVIKPSFKVYSLPKRLRSTNKADSKISNDKIDFNSKDIQELGAKNKQEKQKVAEEEILIENMSNIPNPNLYFPIGFNKNDNPLKLQDNNNITNFLGIKTDNDDDEKEGLLKKTEKKVTNNKKHYRRIYRSELENVKELSIKAPFIEIHLMRNKYEDKLSSLNSLMEAIRDSSNKIIKKFESKTVANDGKLRGARRKKIDNIRMDYIENDEELKRNKELTFNTEQNFGFFKGLIRIAEKTKYDEHKNYINTMANRFGGELPPDLSFLTAFDDYGKYILVKRSVIVRVYVLELNKLESRDTFSESDPYIKILLGDKELVNERKKAQKNCKNCKWYQYYDLRIELPGSSQLKLQVMDYDTLFSDDLIGETSIDIEDRYFDNRWQALESKPIEVRQLYHPDHEKSQGEVLMWIEMFDQNDENKLELEPWNIEPEPKSTLEMRLIIYETEEMENLDIEDTSDIYVMAYVDSGTKYQTDIHYRCSTGQGSFNWRMLIPIEFPRNKFDLTLQAFDKDILSKDDFICGARLNLSSILNDVNILDLPIKLSSDYYSSLPVEKRFSNVQFAGRDEDEEGVKFWVQMEKNGKKGGRVLISVEVMPQWYADLHPVGKGRGEPNMNPYLPPPVGRIQFTLNPFKMLNQFTGPKFRKKIYKTLCWICLIVYLIFLVPYIIYFVSGEIFNPFRK
jgi:hypothetical protein